ncbi:hypothetical protein PsYK624_016690 [Phanerochaete sordida]|uniref:Nucleoporin Nup159/Nup146 N-terminal domain-containing protein n=1 Tax=Phanerochaete sordida TaxID=48140 RepID=A0A9P3G0Q4_9APHY|nr:hypothetical protein PsYK624_016690 [Phanerochaete sordida]
MNVARLRAPTASSVQRVVKEGEDKDADFLALRLLNKKSRVKLSPDSLKLDPLPGKGVLFATANSIGCFAAATCTATGEHSIVVATLAELRSAFASSDSDEPIPFTARHTIALPGQPNILAFALNDSRLVVGLLSGSTAVYDTSFASASAPSPAQPLHVFASPTGRPPKDILANPGDIPEIVAVLYESGGSSDAPLVELLDVHKLQVTGGWQSGGTPESTPVSVCWSPKGKQVAIGMQSGDISTFTPASTSTVKTMVPRPSSLPSEKLLSTFWLSNPDFYSIFTAPDAESPDANQTHMLISIDAKAGTATEVKLGAPFLPFPGMRPPGAFTILLRQWEPTKYLLFVGDSSSSDVGLIGCTEVEGHEQWAHLTLEETSTPSMPLDQDMMDTVLLGLALDVTTTESYTHKMPSGEDKVLPAPPILYAYASDGTVIAWNLLNTTGKPYPGMKTAAAPAIQQAPSESMEMEAPPMISATPSMHMADQPMSGQQTPTSAFDQGGPTSAFGQNTSGPSSVFGQPSAFGGANTAAAPFGGKPPMGFGAFATAGPAKFGQATGFGSNAAASQTSASPATASPIAVSTSMLGLGKADSEMSMDTPTGSGFGGLSLGGSSESADADKSKAPGNNMFGSFSPTPASTNAPSPFGSAASSGSFFKPASGFGAFGGQTSGGAFGATASSSTPATSATSSPAFGSTGFAAATPASPSPAFGSTGFGAKPAFGQSAFGQSSPSFGQSAFGQPSAQPSTPKSAFGLPTAAPASGGFAAFASGSSSFGSAAKQNTDAKPATPVQAGAEENKAEGEVKTTEQSSDKPLTTSAFGASAQPTTPTKPASAFGTPSTPSAFSTPPSAKPATGGAFSNLVSTPSPFSKFDSGFGAFGSSAAPSSSPFFNPPKTPTTPTAFGSTPPALSSGSSAPTTPTPAAKPTFGATSAFGQPSAFGAAAANTPSKPAFGASSSAGSSATFGQSAFAGLGNNSASAKGFSNFSAGGSGFGAFAGEKKSFSELLKSDTDADKVKDKGKSPEVPKAPVSAFSNLPPLPKTNEGDADSSAAKQDQPPRTSVFGVPLGKSTPDTVPSKPRSEGSGDEDEDAEHQEEADEEDFLSDSFEEEESGEEDEGEGAEEDEEEEEEAEGDVDLALPGSTEAVTMPSSSPTIHLTDNSPPSSPQKKPEVALESATTPPGSPDKPVLPAVASPAPVAATSASPASLLGRPTTQPKRSSPLASAPINRDSDDDTTEKLPLPPSSKAAASVASEGSTSSPKPAASKPSSPEEGSKSRPKTPPLQGIFGSVPAMPKPAPFSLAPATPSPSSVFSSPPQTSPSPKLDAGASSPFPKGPPVFSAPSSKPTTPTPKTEAAAPTTPPLFPSLAPGGSLFAQKPASPSPPAKAEGSTTPFGAPPSGNVFGQKSTTPTLPAFSAPSGSPFGSPKPAAASSVFGQPSAFGQKPPAAPSPFTSSDGGFITPKPAVAPAAAPTPTPKPAAQTLTGPGAAIGNTSMMDPLAAMEDGMRKECTNLLIVMARELENLRVEAEKQDGKLKEYYKKSNATRTTADLADSSKWLLGDALEFGRVLGLLEQEVAELKDVRSGYSKAIRELETAMLKATMRKEEIVRFSKANSDAEFTRMLKSRTLGPEHLETQAQLRRGIRLLRDRIQKLEDHLAASKKRLSQLKMGKAGLRPPSLDTINRTYRNIDIAIRQQAEDVALLSERLSKLDLTMSPSRSAMDFRSSPSKRTRETTPNVAATTAAALNAERAAQRLKSALLKARREPLLNRQAVDAPSPPSELDFMVKEEKKEFSFGSSVFNADGSTSEVPAWSLPSFDTSDLPSSPTPSHGRGARESRHGKSVQLKKSSGSLSSSSTSVPPGFSWGPLPGASVSQESPKLPFSLLPKKDGGAAPGQLPFSLSVKKDSEPGDSGMSYVLNYGEKKDEDKPFSLSSSWVTDDFEKK